MPNELEIKSEMLDFIKNKVSDPEIVSKIQFEIDEFTSKEDVNDKPIIYKLYNQWKSGGKGHKNPFNSYLGYYLGITSKKPNGPFTYNKVRALARPSDPDVDSDFDYRHRAEILEFFKRLYGSKRVANIGTSSGLKLRSALTRIPKALDLANAFHKGSKAYTTENEAKAKEIKDHLPPQRGAFLKVTDDEGEEHLINTVEDAIKWWPEFAENIRAYPEVVKHAKNLEGILSNLGVHASGVVVGDIELEKLAPLRTAKDNGQDVVLATQFSYEGELELLGLIKFDFLAISTLTVIAETLRMIKENYNIDIDIENLPLDDKKTFDLYRSGKLTGVFQCDSYGMQKTCMEVQVDRFEDIMAVLALFRPGPMENIPEYCARKKGEKPVVYFHPIIERLTKKILEKTYGIAVYQEQIMMICEYLGGMSKTQGLGVIKGISKKKSDIIEAGKGKFIKGAIKNGLPKDVAEDYWTRFIVPFAEYGFNAAHSCCYAYNSYITAYLKANYPEEFLCAYMNVETERKNTDKVAVLEKECKNLGIVILERNINKCDLNYTIVQKKDPNNGIFYSEIRPSIMCKDLSVAAAKNIIENRPYNSIIDLAEKTDSSVDKGAIEALANAKFFKGKKEKIIHEFEMARSDLKKRNQRGDTGQDIL